MFVLSHVEGPVLSHAGIEDDRRSTGASRPPTGPLRAPPPPRLRPTFAAKVVRRQMPIPLFLDMGGFRGCTIGGFLRDLSWEGRAEHWLHDRKTVSGISHIDRRYICSYRRRRR